LNQRPLPVTIIACVYIVAGAIGFADHLSGLTAQHPFQDGAVWVELVGLIAVVCGAYLLRGRNWARWLALAWIAFHVVVSAFHSLPEFAIHALFCAVIAYFLFRPAAARYFLPARARLQ
jgi:Trk-type K+ transport system membrane component